MTQTDTSWVVTYTIVPTVDPEQYKGYIKIGLTVNVQNRVFRYFPLWFTENPDHCSTLELDRSLLSFVESSYIVSSSQ